MTAYSIAVIGYGSIPNQITCNIHKRTLHVQKPRVSVLNPERFNLSETSPFIPADGLALPIRLGRLSGYNTPHRRFTMILHEKAGNDTVFYALSRYTSLSEAIDNLSEREGCLTTCFIGYVDLMKNRSSSRIPHITAKIKEWAIRKEFSAVIWCDLPGKGISFAAPSDESEILPLLARDSVLLANTQNYIRQLAKKPNALQSEILSLKIHN